MWGGSDELAVSTLERSLDLGINFWDTAPVYGHGRAEELVAMALKRIREPPTGGGGDQAWLGLE